MVGSPFFIARQHTMHAERDIAVPILSLCPSVHAGIMSKRMHTFLTRWYRGVILVFRATRPSQMEPLAGASNTRKLEKFVIFDRNWFYFGNVTR